MESKNKIFIRERMAGKSAEEAAQAAGISPEELAAMDLSEKRAAAGRKGGASKQRVQIQEQLRRKTGKAFQANFELEKLAVKLELDSYVYSSAEESTMTSDFFGMCVGLLQDIAWQRQYPASHQDFFTELDNHVSQEEQKFFSGWPDIDASYVIGWSRFVNLSKLPGLKTLAIRALEQFLEYQAKQEGFTDLTIKIKNALPKIKDDNKLYEGPPLPLVAPLVKSPEEQRAERTEWEYRGRSRDRDIQIFTPTPESVEQQRLEQELQAELRKRHDEAQRLIDQERLRNLPLDAIAYLQGK